jgi:hypothetical protein
MKKGLRDSIDAVSPFWPLVFCVGLGGVIGSNRIWQEFLVLDLIITLSITILIYGRIISSMAQGSHSNSWTILKENWLNYVIAVAIIGAPQVALRVLVAGQPVTLFVYVVFGTLISSVFGVLTIYALPIVFLKKSSLAAILAGVIYLSRNLATSIWIAGIVVITHVLAAAGALVFRVEATPWSFVLVLVSAVVGAFLSFVAFAAASRILLEGAEQGSGFHA